MNITNKRAEDLGDSAYEYFHNDINFDSLYKKIKEWTKGGFRGPSDDFINAVENYLQENKKQYIDHYWYHKEMTRYVLWQYENYLRVLLKKDGVAIAQKFDKKSYNKYNEIEHIYPKDEKKTPEKRPKTFQNKYVNCLGNLSLLTSGDNNKLRAKYPIPEKFEIYKKYSVNELIQYRLIINNKSWDESEITKRFRDICTFVKKYFNENKLYLK